MSKIAIRHLFNQVRRDGHVRVMNNADKIKKNSDKNDESSEGFYFISPLKNPLEKFYPTERIDENFDAEHRNEVLSKDDQFKDRMNNSINKSFYHDFTENIVWQVSDYLNSLKNTEITMSKFQWIYNQKKLTDIIAQDFMANINPSHFIINGHVLYSNSNIKMIQDLKKLIPDRNFQKLIATYTNQSILNDIFSHLPVIYPELQKYDFKNSKNIFKIDNLDHDLVKIVITDISDLNVKDAQLTQEHHTCGVRATIIVSPIKAPIIKYSYFVE